MMQPEDGGLAKRQRIEIIPPAGSAGGAPKPSKDEICWFHERGWCTKGDSCKFSHDLSLGRSQATPGAGAGAGVAQQFSMAQYSGQQAAGGAAGYAGGMGALGALGGGASSADFSQDSTAIVASTATAGTDATAAAAAAGYDQQTIAALYQYQALQAALMSQAGATEYGDSSQGGMDAATSAAYAAVWAAALSNAGQLGQASMGSDMTANSSAGAETAAAIAAALGQYQQLSLLTSQQTGAEGYGSDGAAAAVAGVATTRANYKMQLCKFFEEGKCVKGAFCPYAHGNEEVLAASLRAARVEAAMKKGSKNDVCFDFRDRGKCRFGITCKFSHNLDEF